MGSFLDISIIDGPVVIGFVGVGDRGTVIYVKADAGVSSSALKDSLQPLRTDVRLQTPEQLTAAIQDQIGIEWAIGITATATVGNYVIKTSVNAIVGTLVGLAVFVFSITPFVESHPFQFPNGPVTLALDAQEAARNMVVLVVVAVVSVLIPALQAMRMKILDAIWGT
jgi:hypothetical protein